MSKSERKFSSTVSHDEAVVKCCAKILLTRNSICKLHWMKFTRTGIPAYLIALRRVIEARGGIGDFSQSGAFTQLYRTLSENGNPTLTTLMKITRAAGVKLFDSTVR